MKQSPVDKSNSVGSRIKQLREESNMSQLQLAKEVGFESNTAISLIESGERNLSVTMLEKIADALRTDARYLLGQDELKPNLTHALRADKDLSPEDKKQVLDFIDYVKNKKYGRAGK